MADCRRPLLLLSSSTTPRYAWVGQCPLRPLAAPPRRLLANKDKSKTKGTGRPALALLEKTTKSDGVQPYIGSE